MPVALSEDQSTPITIPTGGDIVLPVPYYSQPYDNLCWAACCQMILGFYQKMPLGGINTIASKVLGQDCTNLANCNTVAAPEYANTTMGINCKPADYSARVI